MCSVGAAGCRLGGPAGASHAAVAGRQGSTGMLTWEFAGRPLGGLAGRLPRGLDG